MDNIVYGYVFAAAAAFFLGTFMVLAKIAPVRKAKVSPYVFNMWTCVGVALSGLSLWTYLPREFTLYGLASGVMFVLSVGNAFLAIHLLDNVALAAGMWFGTATAVSFCSGVLTGDHLTSIPLAAVAMLLLVSGIACMSYVGWLAAKQDAASAPKPLKVVDDDVEEGKALIPEEDPEEEATHMAVVGGLSAAGAAGLLGGLLLTPMHFSPVRGVAYFPSMAVGALLAAPFTLLLQLLFPSGTMSVTQARVAAGPGLLAGVLWSAGTLCSILAAQSTPLAVSHPIMQAGLFVAGLWGVLAFGELPTSTLRLRYTGAGVVVLAGCILLGQVRDA